MKHFSYPPDLYPFHSKWITINGNQIHYIDEGSGEIILFCHPPVASSFMYRNMIRILSGKFRCIALDFPGFGLSIPSEDYTQSIKSQTQIAEGFIQQLQIKSAHLLMQECGGHAAISAVIKQPQLLKGIIITDTIIYPVSIYPKVKRMLNITNSMIFRSLNTNFNFLVRAMTRFGINNRKLSDEERNVYKRMFSTKEIRRTSIRILHELVTEEKMLFQIQTAFETVLNQIPALIIYGEKDALTKLGIPKRIHDLLPHSSLHYIPNEGHFPHEGDPEKMSTLISTWLSSLKN